MSIHVNIDHECDMAVKAGGYDALSVQQKDKLFIAFVGNSHWAVKFAGKVIAVNGDKVKFRTAVVGAVMTRTSKNVVFIAQEEYERLKANEQSVRDWMEDNHLSVRDANDWNEASSEVAGLERAAGVEPTVVKDVNIV
ncbi:hypothetical protein JCM8208_004845 [Rhodotorula glutinis]